MHPRVGRKDGWLPGRLRSIYRIPLIGHLTIAHNQLLGKIICDAPVGIKRFSRCGVTKEALHRCHRTSEAISIEAQ